MNLLSGEQYDGVTEGEQPSFKQLVVAHRQQVPETHKGMMQHKLKLK